MLWWKSHPSTVHFDAELFRPFRFIPVDRFTPQADETIPVQLNAEDLPLNERFSFARVSPSWLSFGSAIKYSFLQSRHIIYIWPKYVVEKNLSVLNKKHPLQQMRKKSLKLNFQGHFWAFLSKNGKYFECLWIQMKHYLWFSIGQNRNAYQYLPQQKTIYSFRCPPPEF